MKIDKNFIELIDIESIIYLEENIKMVDISVKHDKSFLLSNGIVSHNSASGSILQARNSEVEGVYSLKGKVKNAKRLSDLSTNKEILELMSILSITPDDHDHPKYDNIVIAVDNDFDGSHIFSLIINLFNKWFPNIIKRGKLYSIVTPLVVCDDKKTRKYFYSLEEYNNYAKNKKITGLNYLKGLGSLSLEDWKYVMDNKTLFKIIKDKSANKYLNIAFGDSSKLRKKWLEA